LEFKANYVGPGEEDVHSLPVFFSPTVPEGYGVGIQLDLPFVPFQIGYVCLNFHIAILTIKLAVRIT